MENNEENIYFKLDEERLSTKKVILGHLSQLIEIYNTYPLETSIYEAHSLYIKMVLYSEEFVKARIHIFILYI